MSTGRRDGTALGPERYHQISYEELVNQPGEVLQRVCSFLELSFAPDTCHPLSHDPQTEMRGCDAGGVKTAPVVVNL